MKKGIVAIACVVLVVSISAGCVSNASVSQSSNPSSSSGKIALNENTSDAPVPLEKVSVTAYNGTANKEQMVEGLAEQGAQRLQDLGAGQVKTKNVATSGSYVSYIVYRSPRYEQAAREIAEELGLTGAVMEDDGSTNAYSYDGDIAVIFCEDWALSEGLVDQLPEDVQRAIDQHAIDFSNEI